MTEKKKSVNWWKIILYLLFWPFALTYWVWKNKSWDEKTKLKILGIGWGVFILLGVIGNITGAIQSKFDNNQKQQTQQTQADVPTDTPTPVPPTPTPIKKYDLTVTSQIVKKVSPDTYRYFFNVANDDSRDFNGTITMQLYDGKTNSITNQPNWLILGGADTSYSDNPIKAGLHGVIYFDDSHAPYQIAGIDGANTFSFTAKINDTEVSSGKGSITDQYENDLQQ
ncbi:MAG TPA: hypothetical protein VNW29_08020 [Candidatus Sulfotelmatobacter sp.]|jgi:hypothetical protein|nr:hypothetical protein [Candidatus Sulfotelmatobacter sp.]